MRGQLQSYHVLAAITNVNAEFLGRRDLISHGKVSYT
jgi:hypothetical protein